MSKQKVLEAKNKAKLTLRSIAIVDKDEWQKMAINALEEMVSVMEDMGEAADMARMIEDAADKGWNAVRTGAKPWLGSHQELYMWIMGRANGIRQALGEI